MWKRNGKIYHGEGIIIGKMWYSNPSREQFIAGGWEEFTPEPPPPAPKRYSKLKVIRALGERWGEYKAGLEANGLYDQFMAAAWLDESDPAFAAVYATLSDAEKEALAGCLYDE